MDIPLCRNNDITTFIGHYMEKPILSAMLSCSGTKLTDDEKILFSQYNPLGISLFGRNLKNPQQIRALCHEIKETIGRDDVLIAIDQEGGRVRRLTEPYFRPYSSQYRLGQIAQEHGIEIAKEATKLHATLIAYDLKSLGINWNYAPVIDVEHQNTAEVLRSRTFGSNKGIISTLGNTMLNTYCEYGICPCIKHIPGLGSGSTDPHLALPIINKSLSELENDFTPIRDLNQCPAAMTAHILLPVIDKDNPLTQSTIGIRDIIRHQLGYNGFLISDAIDMHALSGSLSDKTKNALNAGCDAICYCGGNITELTEVAQSCRFLRDNSIIRFEKIKKIISINKSIKNIEVSATRYQELIGKIEEYNDNYDATETLNLMQKEKGEK